MIKVQGWDLSLNHGGFVEFMKIGSSWELSNFWFVTNKKTVAKQYANAILLDVPKKEDNLEEGVLRLNFWDTFFTKHLELTEPTCVGIENYAYGKSRGAHQIGELGGIARRACYNTGVKLRLHDPLSIKLATAFHGHADKQMIEDAVKDRFGVDFSKYNPPKKEGKKQNKDISGDLADAYGICRLVALEVDLRSGEKELKDLHPEEIRVFNRVTKTYPINILGRNWIEK